MLTCLKLYHGVCSTNSTLSIAAHPSATAMALVHNTTSHPFLPYSNSINRHGYYGGTAVKQRVMKPQYVYREYPVGAHFAHVEGQKSSAHRRELVRQNAQSEKSYYPISLAPSGEQQLQHYRWMSEPSENETYAALNKPSSSNSR